MVSAEVGSAISRQGQLFQTMGMQMLIQSMDEKKKAEVERLFEAYRNMLDQKVSSGEITPDDATAAQVAAENQVTKGNPILRGTQSAVGAGVQAPDVSTSPIMTGTDANIKATAKPVEGAVQTSLGATAQPAPAESVYAGYANELDTFKKNLASKGARAIRAALASKGVSQKEIRAIEQEYVGDITTKAAMALEKYKTGLEERKLKVAEKGAEVESRKTEAEITHLTKEDALNEQELKWRYKQLETMDKNSQRDFMSSLFHTLTSANIQESKNTSRSILTGAINSLATLGNSKWGLQNLSTDDKLATDYNKALKILMDKLNNLEPDTESSAKTKVGIAEMPDVSAIIESLNPAIVDPATIAELKGGIVQKKALAPAAKTNAAAPGGEDTDITGLVMKTTGKAAINQVVAANMDKIAPLWKKYMGPALVSPTTWEEFKRKLQGGTAEPAESTAAPTNPFETTQPAPPMPGE